MQHDTIAILDYGSQYSQLIARRVREANVFCELFSWRTPAEEILGHKPKGFILSGGPNSVYDPQAPALPDYVLDSDVPVLGICYGMQTMAAQLGGKVVGRAALEQVLDPPEGFRGPAGQGRGQLRGGAGELGVGIFGANPD